MICHYSCYNLARFQCWHILLQYSPLPPCFSLSNVMLLLYRELFDSNVYMPWRENNYQASSTVNTAADLYVEFKWGSSVMFSWRSSELLRICLNRATNNNYLMGLGIYCTQLNSVARSNHFWLLWQKRAVIVIQVENTSKSVLFLTLHPTSIRP